MHRIALLTFLFFATQLFGQYGLGRYPDTYPDPELTQDGYPSLEYFKHFGKKYVQINKVENEDDSLKTDYYKSFYRLRKNRIRVKTISSTFIFPIIKKYKVIDDEIEECNHLGKIRKSRCYKVVKRSEVKENDSTYYKWIYDCDQKDTSIWKSYRRVYNKKRQLIKDETAWKYYAENDSSWKVAETSLLGWGVSRTIFQYLSDNEIKVFYQRISSNSNETENCILTFLYDNNGHLIERKDFYEENKYSCYYKFYYDHGLCISYERGDKNEIKEKTTAMRK
jgi:hypothetical protein